MRESFEETKEPSPEMLACFMSPFLSYQQAYGKLEQEYLVASSLDVVVFGGDNYESTARLLLVIGVPIDTCCVCYVCYVCYMCACVVCVCGYRPFCVIFQWLSNFRESSELVLASIRDSVSRCLQLTGGVQAPELTRAVSI